MMGTQPAQCPQKRSHCIIYLCPATPEQPAVGISIRNGETAYREQTGYVTPAGQCPRRSQHNIRASRHAHHSICVTCGQRAAEKLRCCLGRGVLQSCSSAQSASSRSSRTAAFAAATVCPWFWSYGAVAAAEQAAAAWLDTCCIPATKPAVSTGLSEQP